MAGNRAFNTTTSINVDVEQPNSFIALTIYTWVLSGEAIGFMQSAQLRPVDGDHRQ